MPTSTSEIPPPRTVCLFAPKTLILTASSTATSPLTRPASPHAAAPTSGIRSTAIAGVWILLYVLDPLSSSSGILSRIYVLLPSTALTVITGITTPRNACLYAEALPSSTLTTPLSSVSLSAGWAGLPWILPQVREYVVSIALQDSGQITSQFDAPPDAPISPMVPTIQWTGPPQAIVSPSTESVKPNAEMGNSQETKTTSVSATVAITMLQTFGEIHSQKHAKHLPSAVQVAITQITRLICA